MITARTREALQYRDTTYEVVAIIPGREAVRLGFTARPSKATFIRLARAHSALLLPHLGDDDAVSYSASAGLRIGAVVVRKSGRTERDCNEA
jgi:hypothetical protein